MLGYERTYAEVDLDAISHNIAAVRRRAAGKKLLCVLKADAYGHGATAIARRLRGVCDFFGVACMEEAVELRRQGIETPILLLGYTSPREFPLAVKYDLRTAIFRREDGELLNREALRQGRQAKVHFAVDTGMSRIGFQVTEEAAEDCRYLAGLTGLRPEGMFSHYATADEGDLTRARAQYGRFCEFDRMLKDRGVRIPLRHLDNSAGIMNFGGEFEMVRSGIVTYGLYPSDEVDRRLLPLEPALQWKTSVSFVKWLEPGREVSYGGTYRTRERRRVATVPVGYADGYPRSLSGRFYVLIRGRRAPILGKVCMDQIMVDVTDIPEVEAETSVTLVGRDGGETITVEDIAGAAGTFNYEFICGIARRVPRMYRVGGRIAERSDYLLSDCIVYGEEKP